MAFVIGTSMKRSTKLLLVGLSALLLSAAFFCPAYCCWFVFVFLIPIYYVALRSQVPLDFFDGLWWGLIFFGTHFFDIVVLLAQKAQGSLRVPLGIALIVYCALYVGMWFWATSCITKLYKRAWWRQACWCLTTLLYFYFVMHNLFWIFGSCTGYCFGSPLLPLAHYPIFLFALPFFGHTFLLACLCVAQMAATRCLTTKSRGCCVLFLLCLIPFCVGLKKTGQAQIPSYVATLGYVQPPPKTLTNMYDRAEEINARITKIINKNSDIRSLLMPESSLCGSLNQHNEILDMWGSNALKDTTISLYIGSFRTDIGTNLFVTLYQLKGGRITNHYDKKTLFPFTEFVPHWCQKINVIRNLFFKEKEKEFSTKDSENVFFNTATDIEAQPCICSDFYCCRSWRSTEDRPILLAVNDSWFCHNYLRRLMFLYAVFFAIEMKRDIIYVGHYFGAWIGKKTGRAIFL